MTIAPSVSWAALTPEQRERFAPVCPDFVVEVASPSDRPADLQAKMDEYVANGAQLGWLIVAAERMVYVYRPGRAIETLLEAAMLSGDPVLSGFTLDLGPSWEPAL